MVRQSSAASNLMRDTADNIEQSGSGLGQRSVKRKRKIPCIGTGKRRKRDIFDKDFKMFAIGL